MITSVVVEAEVDRILPVLIVLIPNLEMGINICFFLGE